jgi:alpha-L-rhamnosidase
MFGDISAWFYAHLAGIQPTEDTPGFRRFRLAPGLCGELDSVEAEYRSPFGKIASAWSRDGSSVGYRFEVPPGTEAEICLRDGDGEFRASVGPGCHEFTRRDLPGDGAI